MQKKMENLEKKNSTPPGDLTWKYAEHEVDSPVLLTDTLTCWLAWAAQN